jgi:hypothetical protein
MVDVTIDAELSGDTVKSQAHIFWSSLAAVAVSSKRTSYNRTLNASRLIKVASLLRPTIFPRSPLKELSAPSHLNCIHREVHHG